MLLRQEQVLCGQRNAHTPTDRDKPADQIKGWDFGEWDRHSIGSCETAKNSVEYDLKRHSNEDMQGSAKTK